MGDHWPATFAICRSVGPAGGRSNPNRTRSPALKPRAMPGLASAKVIVIAGQSSAGTGSGLRVTEMAVIRAILTVVSYSVALDAGAAKVADAAPPQIGRASTTTGRPPRREGGWPAV